VIECREIKGSERLRYTAKGAALLVPLFKVTMARQRRIPWDIRVNGVHNDMARCGMFVPVPLGGEEERSWLDCDLASLAENRFGDSAAVLSRAVRTIDEREYSLAARSEWT
jgi:hypothetical protein